MKDNMHNIDNKKNDIKHNDPFRYNELYNYI